MLNVAKSFAALFLVATVCVAGAAVTTVAGVTFNSDNAVQNAILTTDGTLGHSFFTANVEGNPSTFDESHHVGALISSNPSDAIDMTGGTNGSTGRNYVTLTWATNMAVENLSGDDFYVFEAGGAAPSNRGFPEMFAVAVREVGQSAFSSFRYEFFSGSDPSAGAGMLVTGYDLSDFGVAANGMIDAVQVISMHNGSSTTPPYLEDRVDNASGEGNVLLDAGSGTGFEISQGPNSDNSSLPAFPDSSMDADIVYVVSTNLVELVPLNADDSWNLYY